MLLNIYPEKLVKGQSMRFLQPKKNEKMKKILCTPMNYLIEKVNKHPIILFNRKGE
jgi:hypothetical protein